MNAVMLQLTFVDQIDVSLQIHPDIHLFCDEQCDTESDREIILKDSTIQRQNALENVKSGVIHISGPVLRIVIVFVRNRKRTFLKSGLIKKDKFNYRIDLYSTFGNKSYTQMT